MSDSKTRWAQIFLESPDPAATQGSAPSDQDATNRQKWAQEIAAKDREIEALARRIRSGEFTGRQAGFAAEALRYAREERADIQSKINAGREIKTTLGDVGRELVNAPFRGVVGNALLGGAAGVVDYLGFDDAAESVRSFRDETLREYGPPESASQNWILRYGGMGGEAVGSTLPFLIGGLPSVAARGTAGVLAAGTGVDEQDARVKQAREQGLTVSAGDEVIAETFGGLIGLSELLPVRGLLARVPQGYGQRVVQRVGERFAGTAVGRALAQGGRSTAGKISGNAIEEGLQEAVAGVFQDLVELGVYNENATVGESALQDFALGSFAGGVISGGRVAYDRLRGEGGRGNDPASRQDADLFGALEVYRQQGGQRLLESPETIALRDLAAEDTPIRAGGLNLTPTQLYDFAANNASNPRIAEIMAQPVSPTTKVQQVARVLNAAEASRVEGEVVRRVSGLLGPTQSVSSSKQAIGEVLDGIGPEVVAESSTLSAIRNLVDQPQKGQRFVTGLREIVDGYGSRLNDGQSLTARPERGGDGSVIMKQDQVADEAQREREAEQAFRLARVRQERFDRATGTGQQREDLRAGAPEPESQFFLGEAYGELAGTPADIVEAASPNMFRVQYESPSEVDSMGRPLIISEEVSALDLVGRVVRGSNRLGQDLASNLRNPRSGVGTDMSPRRSVDRTRTRAVATQESGPPAVQPNFTVEGLRPSRRAPDGAVVTQNAQQNPTVGEVPAVEGIVESPNQVTGAPTPPQLPAPPRALPAPNVPEREETTPEAQDEGANIPEQEDVDEEIDIDNDPRMVELNDRFDAALERVQETENTTEARKLAKRLVREGVLDEDAYTDIDAAIRDETDNNFKHDTAMAAIEDAIEAQRDNAVADLESEIYGEADAGNTRFSGRTSKRKKRVRPTGAARTTEQTTEQAADRTTARERPAARREPVKSELTKAEEIINDRLDRIAGDGQQGARIAKRLRELLDNRLVTVPQLYAAFEGGKIASQILPKNANVDVVWVPILRANSERAAVASGTAAGQEAGGSYDVFDVSQDGLSGIIRLSLSDNVSDFAQENAAHEAFHVIQDMLEVYDPAAYDLISSSFKREGGVDDFPASILRKLKTLTVDGNQSVYQSLKASFGNNTFSFYEAQAVAFGALVDAKNRGENMKGLPASFIRVVDFAATLFRDMGKALRLVGDSPAEIFDTFRTGQAQANLTQAAPTASDLSRRRFDASFEGRYSGRSKPPYEHPTIGSQVIAPPVVGTSTIPFLYNNGKTGVEQTPAERLALKDAVQFIQDRSRAALQARFGVDRITGPDPKTDRYLMRAIASEAEAAILKERATGNRSALDWYTKAIEDAIDEASAIYPMLADDNVAQRMSNRLGINSKEDARVIFTTALSITSQNMKVRDNARATTEQVDIFLETGRFDPTKKYGTKAPSISSNLALANFMLERVFDGRVGELGQFLNTEFTVAELNKLGREVQRKQGLDKPPFKISGEMASEKVYGSAIFGPKIGNGFYQNLNQNFSPVTIDLWFMRLWGRLTGTLVGNDNALNKQIESLREAVEADAHPTTKVPDGFVERFNEATDEEVIGLGIELAAEWERQYKALQKQGMTSDEITRQALKPDWAFKAVALAGQRKPNDAPVSGSQRKWIRDVVNGAVKMLAKSGYNVTPADLQALVWYPEKDLVNLLKEGKLEANLNVSYDTAFSELAAVRSADATSANTDARDRGSDGDARQRGLGSAGGTALAGDQALAAGAAQEEGDQVRRTLPAEVRDRLIERGSRYSGRAGRRGAGGTGGGRTPLAGAPRAGNFSGPIEVVAQAAEKYAQANGINYTRQSRYITEDEFDTAFAERLARAYAEMVHAPNDPAVAEAYSDAIRQTRAQYDALIEAGVEFYFLDPDSEYASSPFNALRELRDSNRMGVFSTVQGFGAASGEIDATDNPMLADTGLSWKDANGNDVPVLANDMFRAVHDAFGHGLEGAGFRYVGEENAWQAHVRLYTGPAVAAVTNETRGQNSWVNFGPFGEANRTGTQKTTVYADQKTGLLPEWAWTTNVVDGPRYSGRARNNAGIDQSIIDKVASEEPKAGVFSKFLDKMVGRVGNESRRRALVRNVVNDKDGAFVLDKVLDAAIRGVDRADGRVPVDGSSVGRMMEMASQSTGVLQMALELGPPVFDGENTSVSEDIGGLFDIFEPIGEDRAKAFQTYAVARRERDLRSRGRVGFTELTDSEIAETLRNADADFEEVFAAYQEFNGAIIDYAVDTGLLTQELGDTLKGMDYVPYYRAYEQDDGELDVLGPKMQAAMNNPKSGLDLKLKGGSSNLGNLYENIIRNTQSIIAASRKNLALQEAADAVDALNELGVDDIGRRVVTPDGEGIMRLRVDGKPVYYKIEDPAVWAAIASLGPQQMNIIVKAFSKFANVLRTGVTLAPSFMIANLWRGKISTYVTTDASLSFGIDTLKGMKDAYQNGATTQTIKANTGIGGYTYGMGEKDFANEIRRRYRRQEGGGYGFTRDWLDRFKGALVAAERIGEATELAERVKLYEDIVANGGSPKTAAYEAMNLTNFGRKGAGKGYIGATLNVLIPMIPFLNARIQGLYRIAENQQNEATILGLRKKVLLRGMLYTMASSAIYAMFSDDERWEEETVENKMLYDIMYVGGKTIYLPRPFEVGTVFGSLPVAFFDYVRDRDGGQAAKKLAFAFTNTFAMNPIPQGVKPALEASVNHSFFRGGPIDSMADQNLPAGMRYDERTSEIAKFVGGAADVSPKKVDYVLNGYLGTMGAGFIAGVDSVLSGVGAIPKKSGGMFGDPYHIGDTLASASGITRFVKDSDRTTSRFVRDFYELKREADQANRARKKLIEEGRNEEALEFAEEMKFPLQARKQLGRIARDISKVNKEIDLVEVDPRLTPAEKQLKLRPLLRKRKALARSGYDYARGMRMPDPEEDGELFEE